MRTTTLGMNRCKLDGIDVLLAATIRNQDPIVFRITLRSNFVGTTTLEMKLCILDGLDVLLAVVIRNVSKDARSLV
jgi:hypothetical protein